MNKIKAVPKFLDLIDIKRLRCDDGRYGNTEGNCEKDCKEE
jgi:hypothetical protein